MTRSLMPTLRPAAWLLALAALALTACNGGSDPEREPEAPSNTVPASATVSVAAFTQYVGGLPEDDRRDPLLLDGLVPPTSETAEPATVTR